MIMIMIISTSSIVIEDFHKVFKTLLTNCNPLMLFLFVLS